MCITCVYNLSLFILVSVEDKLNDYNASTAFNRRLHFMSSPTPPDTPQPPTQATYTQPLNPVSQNPVEQLTASATTTRRRGDPPPAIRRTPDSRPSSDVQLARLEQERRRQREREARSGAALDTEYGVEQQPDEGYIAAAVEGKNQYKRAQAGAHAGPVGSADGPGFVGQQDGNTAAQLDRKREEHDHILGRRAGKSPAFDGGDSGEEKKEKESSEDVRERQQLRERKDKEKEELDVKGTVSSGTGNVVV
ncbi:hypothetical protein T310_9709 [Rasamsonia emersonii CBS 393.64]|uniref:Uncharacterized protein n=1 Tax=Rasamsonia emersonii (strain ATCC 16479 / CBS 393.64 / IMI 116815) TaxID=1408163 RepID=A0A0F4YFG1_RASE3|nr:hypothetical protein T310_9709 [Rasamsonia emersonii CBS 393.64]KKA16661.1 hypothetical protein T310_9709 [Rasamsonia emersonii CBS 393.64]